MASCPTNDRSVLGLIVDHVGRDLYNIRVRDPGGGKSQPNVPHGLCCLRSEVTGPDENAVRIDRYLPGYVDGPSPSGRHHLREPRVVQKAFRTWMFKHAHITLLSRVQTQRA